jgi:hypothetical protein
MNNLELLPFSDYAALFNAAPTAFDSADFAQLNAPLAEQVQCLSNGELGIIMGLRNEMWLAPFSAPYASVCGDGDMAAFADSLLAHFSNRCRFILPPPIYGCSKWQQTLVNRATSIVTDFNYHYDLNLFGEFEKHLDSAARRNFNRAIKVGFSLEKTNDIETAYEVMAQHHRQLGYHMAMPLNRVIATSKIIDTDFFFVRLNEEIAAAAMYDHSAPGIVQLINWGDDLNLRHLRTMNFMAYAIFRYYAERGDIHTIDLGPASTDGIKNEGLVRFKLALGCIETPKLTIFTH